MVGRRHKELTIGDIKKISDTYHSWRGRISQKYRDIEGFCKSTSLEEIKKHGWVLMPKRYVEIADEKDDEEEFETNMKRLTLELFEQIKNSRKLDRKIKKNLTGIGYGA